MQLQVLPFDSRRPACLNLTLDCISHLAVSLPESANILRRTLSLFEASALAPILVPVFLPGFVFRDGHLINS